MKKLMQRCAYEKVLYDLMETSSVIFPGNYEHIEKQPNKECDFIEITNKTKYEAKLVMTKQLGEDSLSRKGDPTNYVKEMHSESVEFSNHFQTPKKKTEDHKLYRVIAENIQKIQEDENVILFVPYPIVPDLENFPLKGAKDFLTFIIRH